MKNNQNYVELLKKLECLSNIKIEDEKKETVIGYIDDVSGWFESIASVNTSEIKNILHALNNFNDPKNQHCDNILTNKETEHNYFVVPKVIDE